MSHDYNDNWGNLTSWAIHELPDWNQGEHASDPSGDGVGFEPRAGLANVVEQGNLEATYDLIASLLDFPPDADLLLA